MTILLLGNVGILFMIVVMAYTVAYFGAFTPDRAIKYSLIEYLLRGPFVASVVLVIMVTVPHIENVFGLPGNLVTLVAWRGCDHTGSVFENDVLRTEVEVGQKHPLETGGGLVDLSVRVYADRGDQAPEPGEDIQVLDWHLLGLFA